MYAWAPRRIAITGLGAITALGETCETTWQRLVRGDCGIGQIRAWSAENYPTKVAGEAASFDPHPHFSPKRLRRLDRCHQLAIVAAREALRDAHLEPGSFEPERAGVIIGSSLGGMLSGQRYDRERVQTGRHRGAELFKHPLHVVVDELTAEFELLGPRSLISTACTASTIAIGHAMDMIRAGQADFVLTGGVDPLSDFSFAGFSSMKNVSGVPCAPFSHPIGLNTGEGAGILILEDMERALARGARIYAELASYALSADAHHPTSPDPTGQNQKRAMLEALDHAHVSLEDVGYVNAHGTGTSGNDSTETNVLKMVFGQRAGEVAVSSVKGAIGHTLGAAGGIEALITVLAVHHGTIPPTANFTAAREGCSLDYVANEARRKPVSVAVSQNFAFGGNNAVLVLKKQDAHSGNGAVQTTQRVMVTGLGALSPLGCGTKAYLDALLECRDGIRPISAFDTSRLRTHYAGMVQDDPALQALRSKARRVDRLGLFTIAGTEMALQDSGIRVTRENAERIGIVVGTAYGPVQSCSLFHHEVAMDTPQKANPALFPNTVVNAGAGLASINLRVRGPNVAVSIGQASGMAAIAYGYELVRSGRADIIIAGGAEELDTALLEALAAARLCAPYQGTMQVSAPFDTRRSGLVPAEGAGFIVLESLASAQRRNAKVYAELAGYHICADRPVRAGWDPEGEGMERAMRTALSFAGIDAAQIGYLGAAAMSHPRHDLIEARAIERVFPGKSVPVGALTSLFGVSAATGPLTLAATLLGMRENFLPGGAKCESPDPSCRVDLVNSGVRQGKMDAAMVNAASLCGTNVSVVVARA